MLAKYLVLRDLDWKYCEYESNKQPSKNAKKAIRCENIDRKVFLWGYNAIGYFDPYLELITWFDD
jgi:hypothetical protein